MYQILLTPFAASLIAQLSKFFIKSNRLKLGWRSIISYSGMPSSHAAMTVSLTATIGLTQGLNSASFALALVFTILVIRDALGVRRYLGQHSEILNDLVKELRKDKISLEEKYPRLTEKVGHTPAQIIVGSLVGLGVSLISFLVF